MYIALSFFIPPSLNRHLGCFHVLIIVNSAIMNMEMQTPALLTSQMPSESSSAHPGTYKETHPSVPSPLRGDPLC
jgi:hypothetical protein